MSRTIKRGPPPKRPAARRKQPLRKVGMFERAVAALPVSEETIRKAATWTITDRESLHGAVATIGSAATGGATSANIGKVTKIFMKLLLHASASRNAAAVDVAKA